MYRASHKRSVDHIVRLTRSLNLIQGCPTKSLNHVQGVPQKVCGQYNTSHKMSESYTGHPTKGRWAIYRVCHKSSIYRVSQYVSGPYTGCWTEGYLNLIQGVPQKFYYIQGVLQNVSEPYTGCPTKVLLYAGCLTKCIWTLYRVSNRRVCGPYIMSQKKLWCAKLFLARFW